MLLLLVLFLMKEDFIWCCLFITAVKSLFNFSFLIPFTFAFFFLCSKNLLSGLSDIYVELIHAAAPIHIVIVSFFVSVVGWSIPPGLGGFVPTFPVDDISQVVEAVTVSTVVLPTFLYCLCACCYYWLLLHSKINYKYMLSLSPCLSFVFSVSSS